MRGEWLWRSWISDERVRLGARQHVVVPEWLPRPPSSGFRRIWLTESVGQVGDYVLPLPGDERLHVHEFADGRLVAHVDLDPEAGPLQGLRHLLQETRVGPWLVACAIVAVGAYAWSHQE